MATPTQRAQEQETSPACPAFPAPTCSRRGAVVVLNTTRWLALVRMEAMSATVAAGKACRMSAATPTVCGEAMEVPDITAEEVSLRQEVG